MFFFKKSKITIDMFIDDEQILNTTPVLPATRFYPQWMKDLPLETMRPTPIQGNQDIHNIPIATIKACPGIHNYFGKGFIIPLWTDISMSVHPDGRYSFTSVGNMRIETHWNGQWTGFERYTHMKFVVPWFAREKTGISWVVQKPIWNSNRDHILISRMVSAGGITNFKDQPSAHLNIFYEHPPVREDFILKLGTPMVHLIPLTEKKVDLKLHLVSKQEVDKMWDSVGARTFTFTMKNRMTIQKALKEDKCPFRF